MQSKNPNQATCSLNFKIKAIKFKNEAKWTKTRKVSKWSIPKRCLSDLCLERHLSEHILKKCLVEPIKTSKRPILERCLSDLNQRKCSSKLSEKYLSET